MDKETISQLASQMETKEDLLTLLNRIKQDELAERGLSDRYFPFTMKQINYFCNPNNIFHRYQQFEIKKKSGGFRQIAAPRNRSFKAILTYVNVILKSVYTPSLCAMGFTEGRSVVSNAEKHRGQNYVFNTDLKDFFPSIEQPRVWKRLQLEPFNFPMKVVNVLAGLCSMKETREMEDGTKKDFYVLPQGAPTSPIITNMVCDNLDRRLAGLAKHFGLNYSRYADDITFSSMHSVYAKDGEFRKELKRIITGQGFRINEDKTRLQKLGSRQEVTGIVVSDKLNVQRKYVRDIRNILYIWEKYGYSVAFTKFFPKYKAEKGHIKKGTPDLVNILDGKLMYLKMVKGDDDSVFIRLYDKFQRLAVQMKEPKKINKYNITYVETTKVLDFEKNNSTEVIIVNEESKNRYAYFVLGGQKLPVSVNKYIKEEDNGKKDKLYISNCRGADGKQFWLLHYNKRTVFPPQEVNIDELNNDLDSLLNT